MKNTTQLKNWAKDLNRHFTKYADSNLLKDSQHLMKLWNHKLKQDTTPLLQQLKFKTLRTPNADKDELLQEPALIAGRDVKWNSQPPWKLV